MLGAKDDNVLGSKDDNVVGRRQCGRSKDDNLCSQRMTAFVDRRMALFEGIGL